MSEHIRRVLEEGPPHLGAETEGIVTHAGSLEVVHQLQGKQPVCAVQDWLASLGPDGEEAARWVAPDVPETIAEANPPPMRSPRSTAAVQRLLAITVDAALGRLSDDGQVQLLHGAAWRPPRLTMADASVRVSPFKRLYYEFQIGVHGDKVGAAAGDHLNLSAPWLGLANPAEVSRKMIELTGRMRLIGGALSIALSASSPIYFGAGIERPEPRYGTSLTPWDSARLGHVWPGRTLMDVSSLWCDPVSFRRTLHRFARDGALLSGRDIWLAVRAQSGSIDEGPSFESLCSELGLDLERPEHLERARELLHASFRGSLGADPAFARTEAWRQQRLARVIAGARNRVEVRTLETPPAFARGSPGGDWQTPYEWLVGLHAFLEVLFVWLAENPWLVEDLEYGEIELQTAKSNEQAVLLGGLDAQIRWLGNNMGNMTARELLAKLLEAMDPLVVGLGRTEELRLIAAAARGELDPPAARIRAEVGEWYGIDTRSRHNARMLPDDSYPRELLRRSRAAAATELDQIAADLPHVPALDQPILASFLALARRARL
jgi:hypothetical protein